MNVIEAVRKLMADRGCIRRIGWPRSHYVTSGGETYYFGFHYSIEREVLSPVPCACRASPTGQDIIATDWEWQPLPPPRREPTEPLPPGAYEGTITIRVPR